MGRTRRGSITRATRTHTREERAGWRATISYLRRGRCIVEYLKILIWKALAYRRCFRYRFMAVSRRGTGTGAAGDAGGREEAETEAFRFSASTYDRNTSGSLVNATTSGEEQRRTEEERKGEERDSAREKDEGGRGRLRREIKKAVTKERRRDHLVAARCAAPHLHDALE